MTSKVWALFSGGKDSVTTAHYLASKDRLAGVVFLDTRIRAPEQIDHVSDVAKRFGWPLEVRATTIEFEDLVAKFGFARPWTHRYYVAGLKGRPFRKLPISEIYGSGVRLEESVRRLGLAKSESVWERRTVIAPILDWSDADVWAYIRRHDLPLSPCAEALHSPSGDCFCEAFARPEERDLIFSLYASIEDRILSLESKYGGRWGYEKPKGRRVRRPRSSTASPLCSDCQIRLDDPKVLNPVESRARP